MVPGATPVTRPPVPTVAAAVFVLLHTPAPAASERVIAATPQTVEAPLILPAEAVELTVTIVEAYTVPHTLVTP